MLGGIDGRYLCTRLGGSKYIESITTLASPHRGSPFADWIVNLLGEDFAQFLERRGLFLSLNRLTTKGMEEFNKLVQDHPDVPVYSFGASVMKEHLIWPQRFVHQIVADKEGENDSLVSVESSKWSNYVDTLDAEHLELINWNRTLRKRSLAFDSPKFYLALLHFLALQGH